MGPKVSLDGTALVAGRLPDSKIAQRMKDTLVVKYSAGVGLNFVYPIPGHSPMRLDSCIVSQ